MKILVGKKSIGKFCQRNFDRTILSWIRTQGFPARKLDGVWHSDEDLIIAWFRLRICRGPKILEGAGVPVSPAVPA
jgi:hypothetical protein